MQKLTPSLWFDKDAEEAMNFYIEVFNGNPAMTKESKIIKIKRYPGGFSEGPMANMEGKVLTGVFELEGLQYMCLDGGPIFTFSESVSFAVSCKDQEEIDYFWEKLSANPKSEQCGWLKDKFGLSWQIVPDNMEELIKTPKAIKAMLKMKKIVIAELEKASQE